MARLNPLVGGTYYNAADIYGPRFGGETTHAETAPEATEQEALANAETGTAVSKKHGSILVWLGVGILFVILFQFGGSK